MAAQDVAGVGYPADQRRIEQPEDPVVVGTVEEQRVVVRARMDGDVDAGPASELAGLVVELGRDGELVFARAVGHDGGRADRDEGAGKCGGEIDPALRGFEIGADPSPSV